MSIGTPSGMSLASTSNSTFVETTIAVSVSDSLFAIGRTENQVGGAPPTLSCTDQTNSETMVEQFTWTFTDSGRISLYKLEVGTAATKTIRVTNSEGGRKVIAVHKNTATGGFTKDKDATANGTTDTGISSGNTATTSTANEYVIGAMMENFDKAFTPNGGDGWTVLSDMGSTRAVTRCDYKTVSSTGAYAYAGTATGSTGWMCCIATFYETSPGGSNKKRMLAGLLACRAMAPN